MHADEEGRGLPGVHPHLRACAVYCLRSRDIARPLVSARRPSDSRTLTQDVPTLMSGRERANQRIKVLASHLEADGQQGEVHQAAAAAAACRPQSAYLTPSQTADDGAALERQLTLAGLGTTAEFEFAQVRA